MRHYAHRLVTNEVYSHSTCDGCGQTTAYLVEVVISVNEGEEQGSRDEYEFCDPCLIERADALTAAGSRSTLVKGTDQ